MAKLTDAWKRCESQIAQALRGTRVVRVDWGESDTDVKVPDFPELKIDSKYRAAWSHDTYLKEVRAKYAKAPGDVPLLVTKSKRQVGATVCLSLEDFAGILDRIRRLEGALDAWRSQPVCDCDSLRYAEGSSATVAVNGERHYLDCPVSRHAPGARRVIENHRIPLGTIGAHKCLAATVATESGTTPVDTPGGPVK